MKGMKTGQTVAHGNKGRGSEDLEERVDQMAPEACSVQNSMIFSDHTNKLFSYLKKSHKHGDPSRQQKTRCVKPL